MFTSFDVERPNSAWQHIWGGTYVFIWVQPRHISYCTNASSGLSARTEFLLRSAKQMAKEKRDTTGSNCLKDSSGKLIVGEQKIKDTWKQHGETDKEKWTCVWASCPGSLWSRNEDAFHCSAATCNKKKSSATYFESTSHDSHKMIQQQLPYSGLISDTDSLNVDRTSSDGENVLRRRVGIPVQLAPSCI